MLQQSSNARRAKDANYRCRCSPLKLLNLDYIQHFSYGARGFMRVPVSEANDLNYWLGMLLLERQYLLLNIFQIATVEANFALYA